MREMGTFIRSFSSYVNCGRAIYRVGLAILEYLRLKLSLSSLAMMFIASTKDFSWRWLLRLRLVMYGSNWDCSAAGAWGAFVSGHF